MNGKIKFYNLYRGFGVIAGEDGIDRFFHFSDAVASFSFKPGDPVQFTPDENPKGPTAKNISIVMGNESDKN